MTSDHPKRREIPARRRALDTERAAGHERPSDRDLPLLAPEARAVLTAARWHGLDHLLVCAVCRRPPFRRRCHHGRQLESERRDADRQHGAARRPRRLRRAR